MNIITITPITISGILTLDAKKERLKYKILDSFVNDSENSQNVNDSEICKEILIRT